MKRRPGLTKEITRHGKEVFYYRPGHGQKRIRLPDPSSRGFEAAYRAAVDHVPAPRVTTSSERKLTAHKQRVEVAMKISLARAKARAKERGVPFDLTLDWALAKVEEQNFCCPLTQIPFFSRHEAGSFQNPYGPSFDRVVPALGYVQSNVRIVIFAINAMLSDWGEETFRKVADAYRHTRIECRQKSLPEFLQSPAPLEQP